MTIADILKNREIKYLCHFTRVENLESILTNGLYPRDSLFNKEYNPDPSLRVAGIFNDSIRADEKTNAICLSIAFPNSKMFSSLRHEYQNGKWIERQGIHWGVIVLSSRILLDKNCAFYPTNAASNDVRFLEICHFQ